MATPMFVMQPARRQALLYRGAVAAESGGGKSYSAILLMRGLVGPAGRFCVLDTEQDSALMYSDLTPFDHLPLAPPYSPQRYMQAIEAVEKQYDAEGILPVDRGLVIDQISNAWAGKGGVLEYVDRAKTASGQKAGFNAWKDATPIQQDFVERILRFKGHVLVTMRKKTEWVVEKDERGKSMPRKIGLSPVQRDGIEYEFQQVIDLQEGGNASVSKDRTGLLFGTYFRPSIEVGAKIAEYLRGGVLVAPPVPVPAPTPAVRPAAGPRAVPPPEPAVVAPEPPAPPVVQPEAVQPPAVVAVPAPPDSEAAAPPDPSEPVITAAQQKVLMSAAKNGRLSVARLREVVLEVAGVRESAKIPAAKFMAVLAAVVPADEREPGAEG